MHLVHDENGNLIMHGDHSHEHHHDHTHHHESKDENLAVLTYMLQHNEHHATELAEMAEKLEKEGFSDTAAEIREGVENFHKANAHLKKAVEALNK